MPTKNFPSRVNLSFRGGRKRDQGHRRGWVDANDEIGIFGLALDAGEASPRDRFTGVGVASAPVRVPVVPFAARELSSASSPDEGTTAFSSPRVRAGLLGSG